MLVTALEKERQQSFDKGKRERDLEVALAMLEKGIDIALICEITDLSPDRLNQLQEQLNSSKGGE
jgi:predicted transposase/invertase (TIGR01784 family)